MTFFGVAIHVATIAILLQLLQFCCNYCNFVATLLQFCCNFIAILLQLYCNSVATPEIFTLKTRIRVAINCNF